MPQFSDGVGTLAQHVPAVRAGNLQKFAGLHMLFADITALNAAVTAERANLANSLGMWPDGQTFALASEPPGIMRRWDRTAQNSRTVILHPGLTIQLGADSNVVRSGAGVPGAGVGADGDVSVDMAAGSLYRKSGGTWGLFPSVPTIFPVSFSTEYNPPTSNPQNLPVYFDRVATGGNTLVSSPVTTFTYDFPTTGTHHFNVRYNATGEVVAVSAWGAGASGPVGGL
jgi:hypothetical protein